ncbi:MAG: family transcriptional regulator [Microbacteriaceae bacterium]|nr:family transcriptional regulator [Microbacteriaceae bacterium]
MMPRGSNLPAVAGFNETVVLDQIRRSDDGVSRVELVALTGLSPQTISNVTRKLLQRGLVHETGKLVGGPGAPRTILQLNPVGGFAIGVHIDPVVITCVLLDLEGNLVAHSHLRAPSVAIEDPEEGIAAIAAAVDKLIVSTAVPRDRVIGLGVAVPGPVDAERGRVVKPPLMLPWSEFPLRESLETAIGLPTLMIKDVTAAAVAERWMNAENPSRNFVFFYYGTGVGVGMVLNDEVHNGASGNSGNAGHFRIAQDGPICRCGRRGCFSQAVRPARLVNQAQQLGLLDAAAATTDLHSVFGLFEQLVASAEEGEPRARQLLIGSVEAIGAFIVNVTNLLDVDRIVFGGPYWSTVEKFFHRELQERTRFSEIDNLSHSVNVVSSVVGKDVVAVGAACLVLAGTFSPHSSKLQIAPAAMKVGAR